MGQQGEQIRRAEHTGQETDGEQMVVVRNGAPNAQHSLSYYSTTDTASKRFAWVTLKLATSLDGRIALRTGESQFTR